MRRALASDGPNPGFLRPEAHLAVVIVADEDDCSAFDRSLFEASGDLTSPLGELSSFRCFEFGTTCDGVASGDERTTGARSNCIPDDESPYLERVSSYVEFLEQLKGGDADKVTVAAITGPKGPIVVGLTPPREEELWVEPACQVCPGGTSGGCSLDPSDPEAALVAAAPSVRLQAFLDGFEHKQFENICSYDAANDALDFTGALGRIGAQLAGEYARCLSRDPADTDSETAGVQPFCELFEIGAAGAEGQPTENAIPACDQDASAATCFTLRENAATCTGTSRHLEVSLTRAEPTPPGTTFSLRCAF
jgi:hypothetical protein